MSSDPRTEGKRKNSERGFLLYPLHPSYLLVLRLWRQCHLIFMLFEPTLLLDQRSEDQRSPRLVALMILFSAIFHLCDELINQRVLPEVYYVMKSHQEM